MPVIRATLRLCHSSGDGKERRAKGVVAVAAWADMGTSRGEREKKDEVGARWEVTRDSGEKGGWIIRGEAA